MSESVSELPENRPRMIDQRDDPGDPRDASGCSSHALAGRMARGVISNPAHVLTVKRSGELTHLYGHWAAAVGHDFREVRWEDLLKKGEWRFVGKIEDVDCPACLEWIHA